MSYEEGSVKTEYIDPVIFVPNQRCTFELDGSKMAYLPSMRILNLGVITGGGNRNSYNRLLGACSVIKNIRLLDGKTELSALRNPSQYLAFNNSMRTNADNKSSASFLKETQLGFECSTISQKLSHVYPPPGSEPIATGKFNGLGYLDVREVFSLLNSLPLLPTATFRNLKIEIELQAQGEVLITTSTDNTVVRPILAVDYIDDERLMMPMMKMFQQRGARWNEIETDRINIAGRNAASQPAGTVQSIQNQSQGFIGKRVNKLLLVKTLVNSGEAQNAAVQMGFGNAGSVAVLSQKTQYRLNGRNVYPGFEGVSRPNERLGILTDEYGSQQSYPGSMQYKWSNADVLMQTGAQAGANQPASGKAFCGQLSYDCVRVGARVADLNISISRVFDADAGTAATAPASTNLALNVFMFGEVDKQLVLRRDGSYAISYV